MILHLCVLDKFIAPFYEFVEANFEDCHTRHVFYIAGKSPIYRTPQGKNIYLDHEQNLNHRYAWLIRNMNRADKIILHGLWDYRVLQLLAAQPWLLKKCFWVIGGGDLYTYHLDERTFSWWKREVYRRFVIRRIGHFVTLIKGEYDLTKQWYGASGHHHECFTYPSNLFRDEKNPSTSGSGVNVLLGNSANPSNNQEEVLQALQRFMHIPIKVYCPLSYGSAEYAKKIEQKGKELLGDKFVPLLSFMKQEEYMNFLSNIDIAIFAHKRQQAMGNTITLLGMGKKVYMRSDVTQWEFLNNIGVQVHDLRELNIEKLEPEIARANSRIISEYFSEKNLVRQLGSVFATK